jgi:SAM-dependent methyltransferase
MKNFFRGVLSRAPIFIRGSQRRSFKKYLRKNKGGVVFDVGCGDGWITQTSLPECVNQIRFFDHHLPTHAYFDVELFTLCDISAIPVGSGSADVVVMSSVLQVVENPLQILFEAKRLLRSKGRLVLSIPEGYPLIKYLMDSELFNALLSKCLSRRFSYQELLKETNSRYKIRGVGFFNYGELESLLESGGFRIIESEYSPKFFVSLIFQLLILYRYLFNRKALTSKLDWVFFPFIILDRVIPISRFSIERVINAEVM